MRINRPHHILLVGLTALAFAVPFSASAAASAPHSSAQQGLSQLQHFFHEILSASNSQVKTDQLKWERATAPCLTSAFTAMFEAAAAGGTAEFNVKTANTDLLYEASFQMIMQSAKPILSPYRQALDLAIRLSKLNGSDKAKVVALAQGFTQLAHLHTCADAEKWARSGYAAGAAPSGVLAVPDFLKVVNEKSPDTDLPGLSKVQKSALDKLSRKAERQLDAAFSQVEHRGQTWIIQVVTKAKSNAAAAVQRTTTTGTTTTPTTTTTTPPPTTTTTVTTATG